MSAAQCGDRLPGLYEGVTFICSQPADHHGRHSDDQLGLTVEWTANTYRILETAA